LAAKDQGLFGRFRARKSRPGRHLRPIVTTGPLPGPDPPSRRRRRTPASGVLAQRDDVQNCGPDTSGPTARKVDSGRMLVPGHRGSRVAETRHNSLHRRALWFISHSARIGRVEMWRGGLGRAYLLPTLSVVGASLALPFSVSTSRSSNRTCGSPASGSRTRFFLKACAVSEAHRGSRDPRSRTDNPRGIGIPRACPPGACEPASRGRAVGGSVPAGRMSSITCRSGSSSSISASRG
jgi:hypothetical protein